MGKVTVYLIVEDAELPIGTAYDGPTLISLVEIAKVKGYRVSLCGVWLGKPVFGEYSVDDAMNLASLGSTQ